MTPEAIGVAWRSTRSCAGGTRRSVPCTAARSSAARHEAELAERQFLLVNPENRLVAEALERRWNERLRALAEAEEALARWRGDERCRPRPAGP